MQAESKASVNRSKAPAMESYFLHPGQLFVSAAPVEVRTILGSCVSVCLWDRVLKVGGINHYQLPVQPRRSSANFLGGKEAIDRLLHDMQGNGCRRSDLAARVFGGALVLKAFSRSQDLGGKNVAVAMAVLEQLGIPVTHQDTGGDLGRKLIFQTDTGVSQVVRLKPAGP